MDTFLRLLARILRYYLIIVPFLVLESVEDTFAMEIEATHKELAGLEKRIDALHYVYKYFRGGWSNGIIK